MKRFYVLISPEVQRDVSKLNDFIEGECSAPLAAKRYHAGLINKLRKLEKSALLNTIDPELSKQYGEDVRRDRYKEMAILYSVRGDDVYVHRIIPQKMVIYPTRME